MVADCGKDCGKWGKARAYRFTIPGRLSGLNELITAERTNRFRGAKLKKDAERQVRAAIRQQLRGAKVRPPVQLRYTFYELNKRRDLDNVAAFGMKITQDSLVKEGVLQNDGWSHVCGFTCAFFVDADRPRIEVEIAEI